MFSTQEIPDVKLRILEAARELFIKNGYKSTSIRDIATASGTNVAMVNYYYRSKYNLFEIIFEEALHVLSQRVFTITHSNLPFFEMIKAWVESYYEVLLEYPQIPIFILNEINMNPERLTSRLKKLDPYNVLLLISARIEEEVKRGTIRETSPVDFMLNVLSLCVFPFIFRNLAIPMANIPPEHYQQLLKQHRDYVVTFIINSVKSAPSLPA